MLYSSLRFSQYIGSDIEEILCGQIYNLNSLLADLFNTSNQRLTRLLIPRIELPVTLIVSAWNNCFIDSVVACNVTFPNQINRDSTWYFMNCPLMHSPGDGGCVKYMQGIIHVTCIVRMFYRSLIGVDFTDIIQSYFTGTVAITWVFLFWRSRPAD